MRLHRLVVRAFPMTGHIDYRSLLDAHRNRFNVAATVSCISAKDIKLHLGPLLLCIQLKGEPLLSIVSAVERNALLAGLPNYSSKPDAKLEDLLGKKSSVTEGSGKSFSIFLNQAAKAGDTITLALSGLADKFKTMLGGCLVDANGAVITLTEGQSEVRVALVQEGDISADGVAQLSAAYSGKAGSTTSNVWGGCLIGVNAKKSLSAFVSCTGARGRFHAKRKSAPKTIGLHCVAKSYPNAATNGSTL